MPARRAHALAGAAAAIALALGGCSLLGSSAEDSGGSSTPGALAAAAGAAGDAAEAQTTGSPTASPADPPAGAAAPTGATPAELAQIDDPDALLVVVNKRRPLKPRSYRPDVVSVGYGRTLRPDAADALVALMHAAGKDGVPMYPSSGYRSYAEQVTTYAGWAAKMGRAKADVLSARAGYSEHQTGLAADMRPSTGTCRAYSTCFGDTPQAAWLKKHAVEFGFVIRYEAGQTAVTGYDPEPWHLRYVGKTFAARYAASGAHSLEEYFGLPAAPTY
ncbi:M15 family metallopeptidase [Cellulomonas alba]|uniref:M15 family metallopeptidase n=1 Tax=Cellulomonas alba TaxID=3053467 RepID=A0ABT7SJX7_9CELL|nr:M15 family metallopeptidase [Cellulomonas alba]MDM7856490.1 M15 family metallopeptidase [Cellulomonas alba]